MSRFHYLLWGYATATVNLIVGEATSGFWPSAAGTAVATVMFVYGLRRGNAADARDRRTVNTLKRRVRDLESRTFSRRWAK